MEGNDCSGREGVRMNLESVAVAVEAVALSREGKRPYSKTRVGLSPIARAGMVDQNNPGSQKPVALWPGPDGERWVPTGRL